MISAEESMCRFLYQTTTELDFNVYKSLNESGV